MANREQANRLYPSRRQVVGGLVALGVGSALPGTGPLAWANAAESATSAKSPSVAATGIVGADSLLSHAVTRGLRFGFAVVPELLDSHGIASGGASDPYTATVIAQANILVAENSMKWAALRPSRNTFDFTQADKLFHFAALHGQQVRGHNLCWHEALPSWFGSTATSANAKAMLVEHIQTVVGRYAGRVQSWDVVNEAIDPKDGRPDALRKSPWLDLIGPDYLEIAFHAAAKADPMAKLTYNDYGIELDTPEQTVKRGQVLLLLRRLKARGVPIQAVGIQSHLEATGPQPGAGLVAFLREVARLGLEVYITEMDVNTHNLEGGDAEQDRAVAEVYRNYLRLVVAEPSVKSVLTWGVSDSHTWLNTSKEAWAARKDGAAQRPLLFDAQFQPVPAYFAAREGMDAGRLLSGRADSAPGPTVPGSTVPGPTVSDKDAAPSPTSDPYPLVRVPGSPGSGSDPTPATSAGTNPEMDSPKP